MAVTKKAPGKAFRKGITVAQFFRMFPDDETAEKWIVQRRWPDGVCCPQCGSLNVNTKAKRKAMPFRCRERACDANFSAKTGTFMQSSKLGYQDWLFAIYLVHTSLKGVSSMKLHRDLGITQKSAWHMAHRIRKALQSGGLLAGPVEVDETYMGGKRKNMPKHVREELTGRGAVGKAAVVGAKDRETNQVAAKVVESTDADTLQGFVEQHAAEGATVYTDEAAAYEGLPNHAAVKHSVGEYVRGQAHTNGIESFWSMLKRGYYGTYHKMSPKHLNRYVKEFEGRHNVREIDTAEQMGGLVAGMAGKRLRYHDLTVDNGRHSAARAA
jgi:transposase-like protein